MSPVKVGDTIPVRFTNTCLETCEAEVVSLDHGVIEIRYRDGVFAGLRGLIRNGLREVLR